MSAGFAIDVPPERESTYAVFVDGEPDRLELVVEHLRTSLARDRRRIAASISAWLGASPPSMRVVPRAEGPVLPPQPLLDDLGLEPAEAQTLERATHVVLLSARTTPGIPRVALRGAFALGCALASAYEGVLFDVDGMRAIGAEQSASPLEGADDESVLPMISVLVSTGEGGGGWITTSGLRRFGLPDLRWEDVPRAALAAREPLFAVNAAAQWLVDEVASGGGRRWVPATIALDGVRFARANLRPDFARTSALLEFSLAQPDPDGAIVLAPPPGSGDPLGWLQRGLGPLGFDTRPSSALVPGGDPEMQAAMARAHATLGEAKAAFANRGELTYVKRRFEARDGSIEYIWIVVDRWNAGKIAGRLANAPLGDVGYRLGSPVEFAESEADDWIASARDGSSAGNFTGAVLASRAGSRSPGA